MWNKIVWDLSKNKMYEWYLVNNGWKKHIWERDVVIFNLIQEHFLVLDYGDAILPCTQTCIRSFGVKCV